MNPEGIDPQKLEEMRQLEAMKKQLLTGILTREALERLSRVRMVSPQVAAQLEVYLIQLQQTGRLQEKITDEKLREILRILSQKRDVKIKRA
jgi:programmed cell death protein 5